MVPEQGSNQSTRQPGEDMMPPGWGFDDTLDWGCRASERRPLGLEVKAQTRSELLAAAWAIYRSRG